MIKRCRSVALPKIRTLDESESCGDFTTSIFHGLHLVTAAAITIQFVCQSQIPVAICGLSVPNARELFGSAIEIWHRPHMEKAFCRPKQGHPGCTGPHLAIHYQ